MVASGASDAQSAMAANAAYCERHKVFQLFEGLMGRLIVERPDDPLGFLVDALQSEPKPRVILSCFDPDVLAAQGRLLGAARGLVLVDAEEVANTILSSAVGDEAKGHLDAGERIPDGLLVQALSQRLLAADCQAHGWVLLNFPESLEQAQAFLAMGHLPTLHASLDVPLERALAARLARGGAGQPREAELRTAAAAREAAEARMAHLFAPVAFRVAAGGADDEAVVAARLQQLLAAPPPSLPPRLAPALALVGPPGCGAPEQAARLAAKFGAVLVSADALVEDALVRRSALGLKLGAYRAAGESAPDELLCALLAERLRAADCQRHGFVLLGFPQSGAQATQLVEAGCRVRDLVALALPDKAALAELAGRRVDPRDGRAHHLRALPAGAAGEELAQRLVQHPRDAPEEAARRLKAYRAAEPGLLAQ